MLRFIKAKLFVIQTELSKNSIKFYDVNFETVFL